MNPKILTNQEIYQFFYPDGYTMSEEEKTEYELALAIGNERFGSDCEHSTVKNGGCVRCLRKVLTL